MCSWRAWSPADPTRHFDAHHGIGVRRDGCWRRGSFGGCRGRGWSAGWQRRGCHGIAHDRRLCLLLRVNNWGEHPRGGAVRLHLATDRGLSPLRPGSRQAECPCRLGQSWERFSADDSQCGGRGRGCGLLLPPGCSWCSRSSSDPRRFCIGGSFPRLFFPGPVGEYWEEPQPDLEAGFPNWMVVGPDQGRPIGPKTTTGSNRSLAVRVGS
ncbi:MAG: hypothetical protein CM1200mP2_06540 [Planctomycetaceae bacterium]|nr:MAG: hypothetical protein CM1200mP2_06540 [Planctomycetaceae bacterium]